MQVTCRFLLALVSLGMLTPSAIVAADYPSRPITLIAPIGPGGGMDLTARAIAQGLGERLGQSVIVENRPGVGTLRGGSFVAHANPDGYTLLITANSGIASAPLLHKKPLYDPKRDFVPLSIPAIGGFFLTVGAKGKLQSFDQFVKIAKTQPDALTYGMSGPGTTNHLFMEMLLKLMGTKMTGVPYAGSGQVLNDVVAGNIDLAFTDGASTLSMQSAGFAKILAVSTKLRNAAAPQVPSIAELGYPDFEAFSWFAIVAPVQTPPEIVEKLQKELAIVVNSEKFQAYMKQQGYEPANYPTTESMQKFFDSEIEKWGALLNELGLTGTVE